MNKHDRRHSGRRYTKIYHPELYPYEEEVWDDWTDYRDSMRAGPYEDYSKIKPRVHENRKIYQFRNMSGRTIKDSNQKLIKENKIRDVMNTMTRLTGRKNGRSSHKPRFKSKEIREHMF